MIPLMRLFYHFFSTLCNVSCLLSTTFFVYFHSNFCTSFIKPFLGHTLCPAFFDFDKARTAGQNSYSMNSVRLSLPGHFHVRLSFFLTVFRLYAIPYLDARKSAYCVFTASITSLIPAASNCFLYSATASFGSCAVFPNMICIPS